MLTELSAFDAAVRAAHWSCEVDIGPAETPTRLVNAAVMVDPRDRYWMKFDLTALHTDGRKEVLDRELWFDGQVVVSLTHRQRTWMKRPEQNELMAVHGPLHFLGRATTSPRPVPVSEALSAGGMLECRAVEGGLVRISAITDQFGSLGVLEVDVDPKHGYRIVRVAEVDSVLMVAYRVYTTTEWVEREGRWLPAAGVAVSSRIAATAEEMDQLLAAAKRAGFSRLNDWSVERPDRLVELRRVVQSARAGRPIPVAPSGEGTYRVRMHYHGLNDAVDLPEPVAPPLGYTHADVFLGEVTYPDGTKVKEGDPVPIGR